jgi:hypothetical protein
VRSAALREMGAGRDGGQSVICGQVNNLHNLRIFELGIYREGAVKYILFSY